jgi:ketosteroid isomerase-like protein
VLASTVVVMDARSVLSILCGVIDAHDWAGLAPLLADDFTCRYVHTGETFNRATWIQLNADYPGFDRMRLEDIVGDGDHAAARCHVTGETDGQLQHFEVATFVTTVDGRITTMTEVWANVDQSPPEGTGPATD